MFETYTATYTPEDWQDSDRDRDRDYQTQREHDQEESGLRPGQPDDEGEEK